MGITIRWYDTGETILLETFEGKWALTDYITLVDESAALLRQKDHVVHVIADFTKTTTMPSGNTLVAMRHADNKAPQNQGHVVFVNPGVFINVLLNIAKNSRMAVAQHIHVRHSIEEAVELIRALPSLPVPPQV